MPLFLQLEGNTSMAVSCDFGVHTKDIHIFLVNYWTL